MFPDPEAHPTSFVEPQVRVAITQLVFRYLVRPVLGVGGCDSVMVRTTVPETSVEEDRDPCSREDQVGRAAQSLEWLRGDPVAKPKCMDRRTKRDFRLRVPAFVGLHVRADPGRRRPRLDHGSKRRTGATGVPR